MVSDNKRKLPSHRLERANAPTVMNWREPQGPDVEELVAANAWVECGWGKLIFGHTFVSHSELANLICKEEVGQRNIALYLRDPHVVLSKDPQRLFLDPSHTYRLWLDNYRPAARRPKGFFIRRVMNKSDIQAMNRMYSVRRMVPVNPDFVLRERKSRALTHLVAEDARTGDVMGTVTGVDHGKVFEDPERGSSLWCLAVDPQEALPGVGEALVRQLVEHYAARGCSYLDLSVLHDNEQAIALYEKLGFVRVPVFCVKHKSPINEALFIGPAPEFELNPYARLLVDEARRRGIQVEVIDEERNMFALTYGGRTVRCRESLTDMTSSMALSICDDKRLCWRMLRNGGIHVPGQRLAGTAEQNRAFLEAHERVVVKPMRGEQGHGIAVDVRTPEELEAAVQRSAQWCDDVLLEQFVEGEDLRIIVIDFKTVAAAVRRPAQVIGTGAHTVLQLIRKQSRRRLAATGGESQIPEDEETVRAVEAAGYAMDSTLPEGTRLRVRRTANLHTGGTIHDVTAELHPSLARVAEQAARLIDIPVVGLDLLVPDVTREEYVVIEANERPGLANHEPQPTAERFIDLLFPQTASITA